MQLVKAERHIHMIGMPQRPYYSHDSLVTRNSDSVPGLSPAASWLAQKVTIFRQTATHFRQRRCECSKYRIFQYCLQIPQNRGTSTNGV